MRRIKLVYPEFADQVAFLAVGTAPFEDGDRIRTFKQTNGFPWLMAPLDVDTLKAYNILTQASKVVIDRDGIIVFRAGYSIESIETWVELFEGSAAP